MAATGLPRSPAADHASAAAPPRRRHSLRSYLLAFWQRAYRENITGLSAMVAYNMLLAVFPFVLLVLFIFGQVLRSPDVTHSILLDLRRLFPNVEQGTLTDVLDRIRSDSTTIGIVAALGSLWIGASFWGAMDTAFCRIYHVECRGWVEQKRFSFVMLIVVMLFLAASVALPTMEGALVASTDDLPFGLSDIHAVEKLLLIIAALSLTFVICCVIFWAVPKGHMPWRAVWPGALFVTATTGIANWAFPFYLSHISSLSRFGSTLGFILIALIWFYALSLAILAGAVINALRHEVHDTGSLREIGPFPGQARPCSGGEPS
jgi:membrane protein